jgi:Ca2+:H+ antiporter
MIAAFVSLDGRSNWLEGSMLLVLYVILAVAFFFL